VIIAASLAPHVNAPVDPAVAVKVQGLELACNRRRALLSAASIPGALTLLGSHNVCANAAQAGSPADGLPLVPHVSLTPDLSISKVIKGTCGMKTAQNL
jgi:hypothetical protein